MGLIIALNNSFLQDIVIKPTKYKINLDYQKVQNLQEICL